MVFGFLIDVPIVVGGYFFMLVYRKQLVLRLAKVPLPLLATSLFLSVPLIIVEEQIDCMSSWCWKVLIPPTLPFLLVEVFVLSFIALCLHAKSGFRVVSAYSVFGVLWEALLGGLVGAPLLVTLIFAPYVWIGYGFVSLLPLSVLIEGKRVQTGHVPAITASPPTPQL